jgi:hypothetical protein
MSIESDCNSYARQRLGLALECLVDEGPLRLRLTHAAYHLSRDSQAGQRIDGDRFIGLRPKPDLTRITLGRILPRRARLEPDRSDR